MPSVNLVPKEERAREFRRQFLVIPVAGVAVLFIGMVGGYVYYGQKMQSAEEELEQFKQNNANQSKEIAELDQYEAIGNEKTEKSLQITLLEAQRHKWSRTLDDIAFVVPDDIWFKKIEGNVPWLQIQATDGRAADQDANQQDFVIEGRTKNMSSIAVFMVRLGLIPSLENVELIFAEKIDEEGQQVIQFEIGATLVQDAAVTQPAIAPSTGEDGPSDGTGTGTGTTGTSTTSTGGGSTGGTTGTGTSTGSSR